MIYVENLRKEFKKTIKEPGIKGSIKSFFKPQKEIVSAVKDISFSVEKGEILGFIGPNGAGKSTVIKMLTGILTPTSGTCTINGKCPTDDRKNYVKEIGVVFGQRTQLWWDLPLGETYTVLKEIYEVSDQDFTERMAFFQEVLNLQDFMHSTVRTLSLGQRMRADLAAALLHNPKVLYLDEPTIGLDVVVKDRIRQAIREINQKYNTTVILTTHDLNDIEELCQRIIIIDAGKKIYDATLNQLIKDYGDSCSISFEWKQRPNALQMEKLQMEKTQMEKTQMESQQNLGGKLEMHINESNVQVCFSKKEFTIAEVFAKIMGLIDVKDVQIKETELTDIVKRIYQGNKGNQV